MDKVGQYVKYLMKNSTPVKPLWNVEQLHGHMSVKWNYVDGCMIKAVLELFNITGDRGYLEFADNFIDFYIDDDGGIKGYSVDEYNIDNINEGKVLFELFEQTGKAKYRKAIDKLLEQIKTHPRTKSENFWHKKIYPNQVWLDGLYMMQPFYMEYETRYNNGKNYEDILKQFRNVHRFLRDAKTNLLFHGWDETKSMFWANPETGCSPSFWTRSLGWYVMAIIDTIDAMDNSNADGRKELASILHEVIEALLTYQDPKEGMWYQVTDQVNREGNYLETSGSAMIAYAILKGSRLGVIPEAWFEHGKRCFEGIMNKYLKVSETSLDLGGICLVAGLGGMNGKGNIAKRDGSFEYYVSEPVVENDAKGVAPFLLAYTEVLRLVHKTNLE